MGIGEDEEFEHVAEAAWTVGQLRAALEGVADETELIAWVADEPGDQFVREQLVINAGYGYTDEGNGFREDRSVFGLELDFPTGRYVGRRR